MKRSKPAKCPTHAAFSGPTEEGQPRCESSDGTSFAVVTAQERAAIHQLLQEPDAPGGRVGRATVMARAALKIAGVLLLTAAVVNGYADGDEFNEVGCSVAQQPTEAASGAPSAQSRDRGGRKQAGSERKAVGASGDGPEVLAALARIEGKVDAVRKAQSASGVGQFKAPLPEQTEAISESESAQVFRLFGELLAMGTHLVAAPARVFDLMVFKQMTKAETAWECQCVASLITKRVALIERHFALPIERLRAFASDLKERQRTVKGDRYAQKKRGAAREELEPYEDGDQPSLKEEEDGYWPEERQDAD